MLEYNERPVILNASSHDAKGRSSETGLAGAPLPSSNRQKQTSIITTINLWLERGIVFWIFAIAVFAPHSIAATQTAWLCGMLFWVFRLIFRPRPLLFRTPVDYALFGFFVLTGFHGAHVTIGIVMLLSLFGLSLRGKLGPENAETVELIGLYWHFVDVVWIVIFTVVYLIPAGK